MRSSFRTACLAAVTLLAACAGAPRAYVAEPGDSFALSVAKAAGMKKLKDIPAEDGAAMEQLVAGRGPAGAILDAGYLTTQIIAPPPGFSSLGGGVFGLFSLLSGANGQPGSGSGIIAWVPKASAATNEDALRVFNDAVVSAARATFTAERFAPLAVHVDPREHFEFCLPLGDCFDRPLFTFTLTGGKCAEAKDQKCPVQFTQAWLPERPAMAPAIIGGADAWRLGLDLPPMVRADDLVGTWYAAVDELAYYRDISKRLPAWAFIYIAPLKAAHREADGSLKLLRYPVILHQGQTHYFVAGAS